MFMGHYGAAFAVKAIWPETPLPALMLSTQIMDIAFCAFVGTKIEKIEITTEANPTVPIKSHFIPYSHGFEAAIVLSGLSALIASAIYSDISSTALWVIALICMSHWFIDAIVHTGDLPIGFNRYKVGFGLWNNRGGAIALEMAFIAGGVVLLATSGALAPWKVWGVGALMVALQVHTFNAKPPGTITQLVLSMMAVFLVMIGIGVWMDAP